MNYKLKKTGEEVLKVVKEIVNHARSLGFVDMELSSQDVGSHSAIEQMILLADQSELLSQKYVLLHVPRFCLVCIRKLAMHRHGKHFHDNPSLHRSIEQRWNAEAQTQVRKRR